MYKTQEPFWWKRRYRCLSLVASEQRGVSLSLLWATQRLVSTAESFFFLGGSLEHVAFQSSNKTDWGDESLQQICVRITLSLYIEKSCLHTSSLEMSVFVRTRSIVRLHIIWKTHAKCNTILLWISYLFPFGLTHSLYIFHFWLIDLYHPPLILPWCFLIFV